MRRHLAFLYFATGWCLVACEFHPTVIGGPVPGSVLGWHGKCGGSEIVTLHYSAVLSHRSCWEPPDLYVEADDGEYQFEVTRMPQRVDLTLLARGRRPRGLVAGWRCPAINRDWQRVVVEAYDCGTASVPTEATLVFNPSIAIPHGDRWHGSAQFGRTRPNSGPYTLAEEGVGPVLTYSVPSSGFLNGVTSFIAPANYLWLDPSSYAEARWLPGSVFENPPPPKVSRVFQVERPGQRPAGGRLEVRFE